MDNQEKKLYTISAFAENHVGVLNQVTIIFTRRCINIESVAASKTSIPGVSKFTITAYGTRRQLEKVVSQINKRIDIIKAFLYENDDIVYQEIALYKVPTAKFVGNTSIEKIVRQHGARILEITPEYTVIEKTGHNDETTALYNELEKYDIRQFSRSGRVIVTRSPNELVSEYLENQRMLHPDKF